MSFSVTLSQYKRMMVSMLVAVAKLVVLPYMTAKKDVILYKIYVKNYCFYTLFIHIPPYSTLRPTLDGKPSRHRRATKREVFIVRKNQNRKTKEALLHCKRCPFALQNMPFWHVKDALLQCKRASFTSHFVSIWITEDYKPNKNI